MTQKDDNAPQEEAADKGPGTETQNADEGAAAPGIANENADMDDAAAQSESAGDPETLAAELADTKDKLLRALAEVENVRRRAQRDRQDASRYAIADFAREMLSVADNLRRALDSVTPDVRQTSPAVDNLVVGVEMTEKAMMSAFEGAGIKAIEAVGKPFDHNYHEALFEVPDPSQPAGTVVQEMERGYVLHDRLLRPAKVGVAKGGPKAEAPKEADGGDDADPRGSDTYERQADSSTRTGPSGGKVDETL